MPGVNERCTRPRLSKCQYIFYKAMRHKAQRGSPRRCRNVHRPAREAMVMTALKEHMAAFNSSSRYFDCTNRAGPSLGCRPSHMWETTGDYRTCDIPADYSNRTVSAAVGTCVVSSCKAVPEIYGISCLAGLRSAERNHCSRSTNRTGRKPLTPGEERITREEELEAPESRR